MTGIVLHHYAGSLFAEKIRAILGYKQLAWHSVEVSPIMPRPDLVPELTGGYRRIPVLQVGADVYCDTHVITEYLDDAHPERPLHPEGHGWEVRSIAQRADTHLFQVAVALCFQPKAAAAMLGALGEDMAAKFAADRAQLAEGSTAFSTPAPEVAETCLHDELGHLEAQLAASHWLVAGMPTLADFAVHHCLWLIANNEVVSPLLTPYAGVRAWMRRMAGFGHGTPTACSSADALAMARDAEPATLEVASGHFPDGIDLGDAVAVTPVDYGLIPVTGTLEYCTAHACAVLREDERAGRVRVHFPRTGFRIDPAG